MFYHLGEEKTTGGREEGSPFVSCARGTGTVGMCPRGQATRLGASRVGG
jgi:hypothetical protein